MNKCYSHLSPALLISSQIAGSCSQNFKSFAMLSLIICAETLIFLIFEYQIPAILYT